MTREISSNNTIRIDKIIIMVVMFCHNKLNTGEVELTVWNLPYEMKIQAKVFCDFDSGSLSLKGRVKTAHESFFKGGFGILKRAIE